MTIQAVGWALEQRTGSPTDKVLLLVLGNHADKRWACWPGQDTIGREAELGERATRDGLKRLEKGSFIARIRRNRKNGSRSSDLYVLNPKGHGAKMLENLPADSAGRDEPTGISCRTYRQQMPGYEPKGEPLTPKSPFSESPGSETVAEAAVAQEEIDQCEAPAQGVLSFERFDADWPWLPSENRMKPRRIFSKLHHSDRWAAWTGIRLFAAWMESPAGKHVSAAAYLRGRLWENKRTITDDPAPAEPQRTFVPEGASAWGPCEARFRRKHEGRSPPVDEHEGRRGWWFPSDWTEVRPGTASGDDGDPRTPVAG